MKILDVSPGSPLFGYVRPGYSLLSVNGAKIEDVIDFRFRIADERVKILFADDAGRELAFQFDEVGAGDLGLTLDDHKVRTCKNDCIFCFIRQQPQGMRRALYIKDEDYRLSFTHGNFVTLSNTTDEDIARIIEQRLSPIYISVHATDDKLRRCMLKNEKLAPIVPRLKQLAEGGITIHTQVVLCPGVNDGAQLTRTIDDLAGLFPEVETLAVVPVGLTKYRDDLPNLRTYHPDEAGSILDYIEKRQRELLKEKGTRFVWGADEFYVAARRPFPARHTYEEMNQFENGIGMAREFITMFNRRKSHLKGMRSKKRVLFLTGHSAYPFLSNEILPHLTKGLKLKAAFQPVTNRFWGESVTVSGLLTGQDLLREARTRVDEFDRVVLPPNCLNADDLFLDNLSLSQFANALGKPVLVGQYNLAATVKEAFS
jgi:putative radical SAM enzyme (TIGR03279 family)